MKSDTLRDVLNRPLTITAATILGLALVTLVGVRTMNASRRIIAMMLISCSFVLSACTSTGTLGIVTRSTSDNAAILKSGKGFEEIGIVNGESCRFFLLGVIPWGNGAFSEAVKDALGQKGGDAIINVTVTTSLYGFIPVYNIFAYTCTKVEGIAVRFK